MKERRQPACTSYRRECKRYAKEYEEKAKREGNTARFPWRNRKIKGGGGGDRVERRWKIGKIRDAIGILCRGVRQPLASCNRYSQGTNVITAYVQAHWPRIRSRRNSCAVPNPIKWPIRCPIRPRLINAAFLCMYRRQSRPVIYTYDRCFVAAYRCTRCPNKGEAC